VLDPAFSPRFHSVGHALTQLFLYRTISGAVTYALIMAILFARDFYDGLRAEQRRSAAIEYQLTKSQLEALRMQLQPHFLFNALHSVSALIEERPRDAVRMIAKLGAFLRLTLEPSTEQMVPLEEELRFLQLYFEIEQVRLGDRVRFYLEVDPKTQAVLVPSLILQPLVENALKHGAWLRSDATSIRVASRLSEKDFLKIIVRNESGESSANGSTDGSARIEEGLGLSNVRGRLQQLFRGHFHFDYGWVSSQVFQVSLEMPLNREPVPGQSDE
jgi:two-component system, LytTR family, sensor kinase